MSRCSHKTNAEGSERRHDLISGGKQVAQKKRGFSV